MTEPKKEGERNPDPITGESGAHPVGVGAGSAGGAAAGAAVGAAVAGPVGAAVGGVVGAVAGGYAGKGAAEIVNPTEEETYWRTEYRNRPYYRRGSDFGYYAPAYRYGWESAASPARMGRSFEDVEPELESNWPTFRGSADAEWRDIREATRDAYSRVRSRLTPTMSHGRDSSR